MPPVPVASAPAPESCNSLRRSMRFITPSLAVISDHHLGPRVEKVQAFRVQSQAQAVVDIDADARVDRSHHRMGTDRHIEKDLRAELLDDLDHGIEAEFVRIGGRGHVQILRTDPYRDVAANMAAEP